MPSFKPAEMEKKSGWEPLPPGVYQVEIKECKHFNAKGYDMLNMTCEVADPVEFAGKKSFLSLFYTDHKVADLIELLSKKTIKEFQGDKDEIPENKVFDLLTGEFVKFRLGIKEYDGKRSNQITEVISEKKKDTAQAPLDI